MSILRVSYKGEPLDQVFVVVEVFVILRQILIMKTKVN